MSSRERGTSSGTGVGAVLEAVLARIDRIERAVTALQSRSGQSLPADWRFGTDEEGLVVLRRVSTGQTFRLVPEDPEP